MFVVLLTYKVSMAEVDKYLPAHKEFLEYHYKQGILIASGPMTPRTGGVILAVGNDKNKIAAIFEQDPYQLADVADYDIVEFTPVKHCEALKPLIQETEGKLC